MDSVPDGGLRLTIVVFPHPADAAHARFQLWVQEGDNTERLLVAGSCSNEALKSRVAGMVWGVDWTAAAR